MDLFEKQSSEFIHRHIGPDEHETKAMLAEIGIASIDELINKTIPENIRLAVELNVPATVSEFEFLRELK